MKIVYIVRGLPGSGKSTLALKLAAVHGAVHFEADQYFMKDGIYTFRPQEIGDAHEWCEDHVRTAVENGKNVVISNTGTTLLEVMKYVYIAKIYGADEVIIVECTANYGSIHGVPQKTLDKMAHRWVTNEKLKVTFDADHEALDIPITYVNATHYDNLSTQSPPIC